MLLSCTQGLLKRLSDLLQILSLMELFPVRSKDILNSFHIDSKSSFDLLGPDDLVCNVRIALDSIKLVLLLFLPLIVEELASEHFDILLNLD